MEREPAVDPDVHLTHCDSVVEFGVLHGRRTVDHVPESIEQLPVYLGLKPPRVPRGTRHPHGRAVLVFLC